MNDLESLRGNLEAVRERIARAAERAGRRAQDVLLIGVSKTVTAERIRLGVDAGLTALGENRVQEAREKIKILGRPVPWHLIGHLQTNKVRDALELFDLINSLDRLELARELERRAGDALPHRVEVAPEGFQIVHDRRAILTHPGRGRRWGLPFSATLDPWRRAPSASAVRR